MHVLRHAPGCRTCVGRVIEGEVDMRDVSDTIQLCMTMQLSSAETVKQKNCAMQIADLSFTLEDEEVEQVS